MSRTEFQEAMEAEAFADAESDADHALYVGLGIAAAGAVILAGIAAAVVLKKANKSTKEGSKPSTVAEDEMAAEAANPITGGEATKHAEEGGAEESSEDGIPAESPTAV